MIPDIVNMDEQLEGVGNPFYNKPNGETLFPKEAVLKLFTGSLSNPEDCAIAEDLLTRSMRIQGYLKKPNDVAIIDRQGTFDKNGDYHIYIYYAMMPEKKEDA